MISPEMELFTGGTPLSSLESSRAIFRLALGAIKYLNLSIYSFLSYHQLSQFIQLM